MRLSTYLHFLRHALLLRLNPKHRVPLTVNVQILLRCSNRCLYCAQEHDAPTRLSLAVLKGVFDDAWRLGTRRIHLTGGEPLLREDLSEIVGYAKGKGFFVSLATNGFDAAKQLPALQRVDRVLLSFDGPFEVRERLCGRASAEASAQAVALFDEHRIPFWTTTVMSRPSLPHLDWIVAHAEAHRAQANFVLFMTQEERGGVRLHPAPEEVRALIPSEQEDRAAVRRLLDLKRQGRAVGSSAPYLEALLAWPDYGRLCSPRRSPLYRCLAWRSTCELLADGRLYSCDWSMKTQPGLSVVEHGFARAFELLPRVQGCRSCANSCCLEANLIFSLNPRTVFNWIRHLS